jgi:hypothetical protein
MIISGPKTDEVATDWRKLHNVEFHILYALSNIIRTMKSKRMRWTGHVARMGRREFSIGYQKEIYH